jgi:hypothetical protein
MSTLAKSLLKNNTEDFEEHAAKRDALKVEIYEALEKMKAYGRLCAEVNRGDLKA